MGKSTSEILKALEEIASVSFGTVLSSDGCENSIRDKLSLATSTCAEEFCQQQMTKMLKMRGGAKLLSSWKSTK